MLKIATRSCDIYVRDRQDQQPDAGQPGNRRRRVNGDANSCPHRSALTADIWPSKSHGSNLHPHDSGLYRCSRTALRHIALELTNLNVEKASRC